ncbi:MAG TPA: SDR family NAD(P)-dependent oxidoreductase [Dongiaceae bacterium]|nr:SDR family NAD(P)-dependent oxidoreductase [Dongiaceae bacterium]
MTETMNFQNRWVLVTGASAGLGREMACQLARVHKANLILVARRAVRLLELKNQLEQSHGVQCRVVQADLTNPQDVDRVYQEGIQCGDIYAVILNAGVTHFGHHQDLEWAGFETMLATNVTSVVRLVNLFVPYLIQKYQGGGILLVASLAGLLPVPYQAAYAGTKGFVTQFGESLYQELRGQNLSVTVFCPGGIATEMMEISGLNAGFENSVFLQDTSTCAAAALTAFARRDYLPVPGILNQVQLFFSRFLPRRVLGMIAANVYRKALQKR